MDEIKERLKESILHSVIIVVAALVILASRLCPSL